MRFPGASRVHEVFGCRGLVFFEVQSALPVLERVSRSELLLLRLCMRCNLQTLTSIR